MIRRSLVLAGLSCGAATFLGCTEGKTFIALSGDYEAYRETRIETSPSRRLAADVRYLKERPEGRYVDDVRSDLATAEPHYYATHSSTAEGLEAYLEIFPKGAHAGDARISLSGLRAHDEAPDALAAAAADTRRRLDENARSRALALAQLTQWIEASLQPGVFATPLRDGPKELVVPFSLGLPAPVCETFDPPKSGVARRCVKHESAEFVVPRNKTFAEVALAFDMTVDMDPRGVPLAISISGPDLFERLDDTYLDDATLEDGAARRAAGIARIIEVLTPELEGRVSSDPDCMKPDVQAPDVLHFACHGLVVTATSGGTAGANDLVWIAPRP